MNLRYVFYAVLIPIFAYCLYLLSFFPLIGEIHLSNDIGRDFLLLQELDQKKIVLIGPRSNTQGVFHGPLWTYMNYPAYLIGKGDPVIVAWFWVILAILFLLTTFIIVKKLFGEVSAVVACLLLATRLIPHVNSVFSPEAMFFFTPIFIYTVYKYIETKKINFLFFHLICVCIFVQLNIGVGILFFLMSAFLILVNIYKNKLWKHFLAFLIIPALLSNFIFFDFRHDFRIAKGLLNLTGSGNFIIPLNEWLANRIDNTATMQIFAQTTNILPFIYFVFGTIFIATLLLIKEGGKRLIYAVFVYYYFGYMALSYFNKGILLYHYVHLLIPLTTIWLASFLNSRYKILFAAIVFIVFTLNFNYAKGYVNDVSSNEVGKVQDSWTALKRVGNYVAAEQKGREFGYFVFSPDSFAYQQRYAMIYIFKSTNSKAIEYTKKPITYIIASPPPPDDPYMTHVWWDKNEVKITKEPIVTKEFPAGYVVEKFLLSDVEQKVPYEPTINIGLSFR